MDGPRSRQLAQTMWTPGVLGQAHTVAALAGIGFAQWRQWWVTLTTAPSATTP